MAMMATEEGEPSKAIVELDGCFALESTELVGRAVEL